VEEKVHFIKPHIVT